MRGKLYKSYTALWSKAENGAGKLMSFRKGRGAPAGMQTRLTQQKYAARMRRAVPVWDRTSVMEEN